MTYDFHFRYSTKFRKASASSLKSTESDSPHIPDSQPGSGSGSQRSSTSRESVPPELPAKPSHGGSTASLAGGGGPPLLHNSSGSLHHHHHHGSATVNHHGTVAAVPAMARLPPPAAAKGEEEGESSSLADAFSTEMLAWYEQKQNGKPSAGPVAGGGSGGGPPSHAGKPATLV